MKAWKEIVQNYIIKYSDKTKAATQPLRDHFNIDFFTYHRIDKEGKFVTLLDQPNWGELYVNEKLFLHDPYLRNPEVYQSGLCLHEMHEAGEFKEQISQVGERTFDNNDKVRVFLIEKGPEGVEFFGFSGNRHTSRLNKLYLNHPWVLKSFAEHFKKELKGALQQMKEESFSLLDLKGPDYLTTQPVHPDIDPSTLFNYLKDLGKGPEIELAMRLSQREKQCLNQLLQGKTAKEIAMALDDLSPRTIEFYLENIKKKLRCSHRGELFLKAQILAKLGLI
jgi:DNA-binding CsgD family transcriptional regulator